MGNVDQHDAGNETHELRVLRDMALANLRDSQISGNGRTPIDIIRAIHEQATKNGRAGDVTVEDVKKAMVDKTGVHSFGEIRDLDPQTLPIDRDSAVMQAGKRLLASRIVFNGKIAQITQVEPFKDNDALWGREIDKAPQREWESEQRPYKDGQLLLRTGTMGSIVVTQLSNTALRQLVRIAQIDASDSDIDSKSAGVFLLEAGQFAKDRAGKHAMMSALGKRDIASIPQFDIEQLDVLADSAIEPVPGYPGKGKTLPHGSMGMWRRRK